MSISNVKQQMSGGNIGKGQTSTPAKMSPKPPPDTKKDALFGGKPWVNTTGPGGLKPWVHNKRDLIGTIQMDTSRRDKIAEKIGLYRQGSIIKPHELNAIEKNLDLKSESSRKEFRGLSYAERRDAKKLIGAIKKSFGK
ncbi:MAG: hypothetical protein WC514_00315 [Candidatus Paceibacterota bacterium]